MCPPYVFAHKFPFVQICLYGDSSATLGMTIEGLYVQINLFFSRLVEDAEPYRFVSACLMFLHRDDGCADNNKRSFRVECR